MVAIGVYVAASGAMVFQQSELLLALCMAAGGRRSLLSLGHLPVTVSRTDGGLVVVATVVLATLAANRYVVTVRWHRPSLAPADWAQAAEFLAYGMSCGLLLSALIGFAAAMDGSARALSIAVWPLLLTLGPDGVAAPLVPEPGHGGAQRQPRSR